MLTKSSKGIVGGDEAGIGNLVRVAIELTGRTPVMFNRILESVLYGLPGAPGGRVRTNAGGKEEVPDAHTLADSKLYKSGDQIVMPAENMMACLIEAGRFIKLDGKKQLSTGKTTILPGMLFMEQPFFPLESKHGWQVDFRAGRNDADRLVALTRPRFDEWKFKLSVVIDLAQIPENVVRSLFDIAGLRVGLCEFRPQRKGVYGQFMVTHWERTDDSFVWGEEVTVTKRKVPKKAKRKPRNAA